MPAILNRNAPAPTDPQAEFDARLAEQLKKLGGLRRELDAAREEYADASVQLLTDGSGADKVNKLDKRVAQLDSEVEGLELVVTRARAVQRKFMAASDAATMEAVQKQRATIRAEWYRVVERELAVIADLAALQAQAGLLEQEDQVAATLAHDLCDRSLGRQRVPPGITGGTTLDSALLRAAVAFARQAAVP